MTSLLPTAPAQNRSIHPILCAEIKPLLWKIDPQLSAHENLVQLLEIFERKHKLIESNHLPVNEHIMERKICLAALEESQQNLHSLYALKEYLHSEAILQTAEEITELSSTRVIANYLKLKENEAKLRKESIQYQEAWTEIEACYFLKLTLYFFEIQIRELQSL